MDEEINIINTMALALYQIVKEPKVTAIKQYLIDRLKVYRDILQSPDLKSQTIRSLNKLE
jgi:hypothetical protein